MIGIDSRGHYNALLFEYYKRQRFIGTIEVASE